jgi:hypothetical protein
MCDVYAIYDPAGDRVVGIYGTNKTIDDERRKMLATVDQSGEYWHKEAQGHPSSWRTPEALEFVLLDTFFTRGDRNTLVKEWRSRRFAEARSIAKKQTGQTTPGAGAETECPDPSDLSFVECVEQWVDLTTSLFGGDTLEWIKNASDADKERTRRLLGRLVGADKSCELAKSFYNVLNNYENFPEMFVTPTPVNDPSGVPF